MLLRFPAWQVLENTEDGMEHTEGSLMSALDKCIPDVSCIWQVLENTGAAQRAA